MSSNEELISVIMSTKDDSKTIDLAIKSILQQTYGNFELLIIDDGSKDDTFNILQKYSKKDSRVKIYKNDSNLGLTKSLNQLISLSNGEYIARQDADDYSTPERLQIQLEYINRTGVDAVTSRARVISNQKKIPGLTFFIPLKISTKFKNPFIHGTLLIKKKVMNEIGNYNENFLYAQDYKLFIDLLNLGYRIKNLNEILYYLNMEDNISANYSGEQKYYFESARKNIIP